MSEPKWCSMNRLKHIAEARAMDFRTMSRDNTVKHDSRLNIMARSGVLSIVCIALYAACLAGMRAFTHSYFLTYALGAACVTVAFVLCCNCTRRQAKLRVIARDRIDILAAAIGVLLAGGYLQPASNADPYMSARIRIEVMYVMPLVALCVIIVWAYIASRSGNTSKN